MSKTAGWSFVFLVILVISLVAIEVVPEPIPPVKTNIQPSTIDDSDLMLLLDELDARSKEERIKTGWDVYDNARKAREEWFQTKLNFEMESANLRLELAKTRLELERARMEFELQKLGEDDTNQTR